MREFDSAGLRELARVLQISTGSPQEVSIQDEIVQQTIVLNPFLRRGLAPPASLGIFTASILNTHAAADTQTTDVNPYSPATTFVGNGYPPSIGPELDVWLLQANAFTVTGTGAFGGGFVGTISDSTAMGWRNEADAVPIIQPIMVWLQEVAFGNRTQLCDNSGVNLASHFGFRPMRISRASDTRIRFETVRNAAGASTYKVDLTLGVFPAGMGQDFG